MDYEPLGPMLTLKVKHGVDFRGKRSPLPRFVGSIMENIGMRYKG